ncbi:MAG: hypothetical protein ACRDDF_05845 [Aeromonas sp.]
MVKIEDLEREFPGVFTGCESNGMQKFCKVEKCKIATKKGQIIKVKGQNIPQALREKTEEYIKDLEKRGVIRRSISQWRNPIRAIEKPDGKIRLVSNFMALNDLVEKDCYELRTIKE